MNFLKRYLLGIIASLVFFLVGIISLSDYGLNVDEPIHFIRGQAYLHYLTTGQKEYSASDFNGDRASVWKYQQYGPNYFLTKDSGHPSLNDILAAIFNRIFYEKLGIAGDLESYHLFELFTSSLLVFVVYYITRKYLGIFPALVSTLSLCLYPLFFAESKFNVKDPIETTFFSISLLLLYEAFISKSIFKLLIGVVSFAFALGTKFNIFFLPIILAPSLLIHLLSKYRNNFKGIFKDYSAGFYILLAVAPLIILGIYFLSRPYIWADPLSRIVETFKYYKDIGTGNFVDNRFIFAGWNFYAPFFIVITSPPQILLFTLVGLGYSFKEAILKKNAFYLLIIVWFIVPILRVMYPGTTIYSGVRQIMEYLPALAILSGIGALATINITKQFFKNVNVSYIYLLIILMYLPLIIILWKIHPNQNVYINYLIGGIKGAYQRKVPGTGETMGNVYLQGIKWLNENAETNAKLGTAVGLRSNIPIKSLRGDISFGPHISGMDRLGEYMIEKISIGFPPSDNFYIFNYLNKFLNPVYEVRVDGVTLLKIWKNDLEHTKQEYKNESVFANLLVQKNSFDEILIRLPSEKYVTRLTIHHDNFGCIEKGKSGESIQILADDNVWKSIGGIFSPQGPRVTALQTNNQFVFFFAAEKARVIKISSENGKSCLFKVRSAKVHYLEDLN